MKKLFFLLFITIFISGCGDEPAKEELPPLVRVMIVGKSETEEERNYTGQVVSRYETPLSFQVSGEINARFVNQGDFVRKGDALMTINTRDTVENVNAAAADVAAKRAESELAAVNLTRYEELYAANAVPKSALDEAITKANATRAALNAAEANLTRAQNANDYTNLLAPMDGVVVSVKAETGQVAAAGSPVLILADTNALEAEMYLPEAEFASVAENIPAMVEFYGVDGNFPATVREITPAANAQSRAYRVRLALTDIPPSLTIGKSVKIKFKRANITANIPLSAIDHNGSDTFCWVVEDGRAKKKAVSVSVGENNTANVNLPAGTAIITAGIHLLKENMEVRRDDVK